jgi:hypothetical protein
VRRRATSMLAIIRKRLFLDSSRAVRSRPAPAPRPNPAEWIDPSTLATADGALRRDGQSDDRRHGDWSGTLIRHAPPTSPMPIDSLAYTVSLFSGFGTLMTAVGRTTL